MSDLAITSLGIPTGSLGWSILQKTPDTQFKQFANDPVMKADIAYFKANIGKATTAAKLLADPRLAKVALTAYGLTAQTGYTALMTKVLNSNPANTSSFAAQLTSPAYTQIAAAFGYGVPAKMGTPAVPSSATVNIDTLDGSNGFDSFSGTFAGIALSNVSMRGATTREAMAADLQAAFQKADGGATNIKVAVSGLNLVFTDASGRGTAANLTWNASADSQGQTATATPVSAVAGSLAIPATAAVASEASVSLTGIGTGSSGLQNFNGTFGGVTLKNVSLIGAQSYIDVANTLTAAFQKADGGASNITVVATKVGIQFQDASGRGSASNFTWATYGGAGAAAPNDVVAGNIVSANSGGPNIGNPTFINTVIGNYQQSEFQSLVGNDSNTLRSALYAQQNLPKITNWYSVIADTNLATVVETGLGLPSSFPTLNVDQQASILKSKMNIKDFQNPAKLKTFLNKYVALGSAQEAASNGTANPLLTLFGNSSGSTQQFGLTLSSGSASALLLST